MESGTLTLSAANTVASLAAIECCEDNPHVADDFIAGDKSARSWLLGYAGASLRTAGHEVPSDDVLCDYIRMGCDYYLAGLVHVSLDTLGYWQWVACLSGECGVGCEHCQRRLKELSEHWRVVAVPIDAQHNKFRVTLSDSAGYVGHVTERTLTGAITRACAGDMDKSRRSYGDQR